MKRTLRTTEDLLNTLDDLFPVTADWWDNFYRDRTKPIPFFVSKPDENLVQYVEEGLIPPGKALDLGCGPGRNALYLAGAGFDVHAIDLSETAITWAKQRDPAGTVTFHHGNALAATGPYDLIYDSGCFHHLAPHRRITYLAMLDRALKPGGHFALTCFTTDEGTAKPDIDLYRQATLDGGVGYTPDDLCWIFQDFTELELRQMQEQPPDCPTFGKQFLWTALFRREKRRQQQQQS